MNTIIYIQKKRRYDPGDLSQTNAFLDLQHSQFSHLH